jgi:hypothetical protein
MPAGTGLAVRCLAGKGFVCPLPLLIIQVMGRLGSPLPTPGKISSWPDRLTRRIRPPRCSCTSWAARGSLRHVAALPLREGACQRDCSGRNLRLCEVDPPVEVARATAKVGSGPADAVRLLPWREGSWAWLLGRRCWAFTDAAHH